MLKTVIVIPDGEILPDGVVSAFFFLSQANAYRASLQKSPVFDLTIAGQAEINWLYNEHIGIKAVPIKDLSSDIDLIIVPGFLGDKIPLEENVWVIRWLRDQYFNHKTELASLCTGAFLLAESGALSGKRATTHWAYKETFSKLFPKILLEADKIITDEEGTYTSAGAFSSLNLLLYLIEKFADKETSIWLSKVFQVDLQRNSQKPFMIISQLYNHDDNTVKKIQQYIEQNYSEKIFILELAEKFALSNRTLVRRFKSATGITPIEFLQQVRVEAAKRMLENGNDNINEIIFKSGYNDGVTFRKVFRKHTGLTPIEYRNKYKISL